MVDVVNFATFTPVNGRGATLGIAVGAIKLIGAGGRLSAPTAGVTIAAVKTEATANLRTNDFLLRGTKLILITYFSPFQL
ncbi:MAG: hypothetical protein D4R83_03800 [Streptomycetaceae bacterium]|nr:MAG: hypothetical protein D4R83_03800 [Streptomycetaceae bacterium]